MIDVKSLENIFNVLICISVLNLLLTIKFFVFVKKDLKNKIRVIENYDYLTKHCNIRYQY